MVATAKIVPIPGILNRVPIDASEKTPAKTVVTTAKIVIIIFYNQSFLNITAIAAIVETTAIPITIKNPAELF